MLINVQPPFSLPPPLFKLGLELFPRRCWDPPRVNVPRCSQQPHSQGCYLHPLPGEKMASSLQQLLPQCSHSFPCSQNAQYLPSPSSFLLGRQAPTSCWGLHTEDCAFPCIFATNAYLIWDHYINATSKQWLNAQKSKTPGGKKK